MSISAGLSVSTPTAPFARVRLQHQSPNSGPALNAYSLATLQSGDLRQIRSLRIAILLGSEDPFTNVLQQGVPNETAAAIIVSSDEYFAQV
jgi:hypothetical protein